MLLPIKGPHTRLIQTLTHRCTCHVNKHKHIACRLHLHDLQSWSTSRLLLRPAFFLVNVFVFSPLFFVRPTLQAESLCLRWSRRTGSTSSEKYLLSYTHSVTPTSPSCPASFHLRHRSLVPPGELSLSVHFTQDWCHSQSWNFQLSFVSFLWFHVHDDARQILRYGEPKLAFGYFKIHLKIHELNYIDIKVTLHHYLIFNTSHLNKIS